MSDPNILIAGLLIAIILQSMEKRYFAKIAIPKRYREGFFILLVTILLVPVFLQNHTFFTISPDSQGLLRSPADNKTYRPPLLWSIYRLFASQKEIDEFFNSSPKSGVKLNQPEILQGSNFLMLIYLLSLVFLFWVIYKFLKLRADLLVLIVLIQTSGPIYFSSDYYFIPAPLVPVYKILFYVILARFAIIEVSKLRLKVTQKSLKTVNSIVIVIIGSSFLLVSSRSSLLVDELNQVMTETMTITLVNLILALCVILFSLSTKVMARILVCVIGIIAGLLVIAKLSTVFVPFAILFFIFMLKQTLREKFNLSAIFLIMAILPSLTSTFSGANSQTSQTWYGLVSYAIEFQSEKPVDLKLSKDSQSLLDAALDKRTETREKYSEVVRGFDFIFQGTSISLYYAALPAAEELGFNKVSPDYTSRLFKEITISSFTAHKSLAVKALVENLKVPIGLFKLDDRYMSMSKIFKNPIVYLMFLYVLFVFYPKRTLSEFLLILLLFSFVVINYLLVSVFNGPVPRYFYLYDPLALYSFVIMLARCTKSEIECKK